MNTPRLFACFLAAACAAGALAGPLTPPGAPAPTMKTIEEAEPRAFISQADVPFTITKPGSYYLSENLFPVGVGGPFVIRIVADNVTLDLRGFAIFGATEVATALDGVLVDPDVENATIHNGAISFCLDHGVNADGASFVTISSMGVSRSGDDGVVVGSGAVIRDSHFYRNGGRGVLATGVGGAIENSVAENNSTGFFTADGMAVSNSTASLNSFGFFVGDGATLENCAAIENTQRGFGGGPAVFMHCTATRNGIDGFNTSAGSRLYNCTADQNQSNGFRLPGDSHARDCSANANGLNGFAVATQDNRLDACSAYENGTNGFSVTGSGNLLVRSSAGDNTGSNFNIGAGNLVGPIVTPANIAVSANPHANYEQ
ncbi:MAG: right-handed parallel beta-helix repeat-containing protein [Phycisphaerales bacterium]